MNRTRLIFSGLLLVTTACAGADEAEDGASIVGAPLTALTAAEFEADMNSKRADTELSTDGVTQKACGIRSFQSTVQGPFDGVNYGSYATCFDMCPAGSFVYQLAVRDEDEQGGGDDTAINTIEFGCFNRSDGMFRGGITSKQGFWGDVYVSNIAGSTDDPAVGADVWQVPSQGNHDDAGMLMLQLRTRFNNVLQYDSVHFTSLGTTNWQTVDQHASCPSGQAICGLETRVESKRGTSIDDTTLNGLRLACCTFQ
jgi:hypothetical protein